MGLGNRTAEGYVLLLATVFLLAAPFFAPGGGYTRISGWKAAAYVVLTLPFLLTVFLDRPRLRELFRGPERLLALLWLLCCLLSALFSPWPRTAFLGGSRREGLLHLALYGLSFLLLSLRQFRLKPALRAFGAGVFLLDLISALQLSGTPVLGLYPPGMGWADANIRYAGAYLGTVGNAGLTGAVLTAAVSLFYLLILEKGGRNWLWLPLPLFSAWVLAGTDLTAPTAALGALALLSLLLCGDLARFSRWLCETPLLAAVLLSRLIPPSGGLALALLSLLGWLLLRLGPGERRVRAWSLCLFLVLPVLGILYLLQYEGGYAPLLDARDLLRGRVTEEMGSGRLFVWRQVLAASKEHLLLGTGPDTLSLRSLTPYLFTPEGTERTVALAIDAAHSELLQDLVCCGLPAALCRLGLMLCAALRFFRGRGAERICAGAALGYAIQALFGISMCASAPVFWVLLALSTTKGGPSLAPVPPPDR